MKNKLFRIICLSLCLSLLFGFCLSCTDKGEKKEGEPSGETVPFEENTVNLPNNTVFCEGGITAVLFLPEGYMETTQSSICTFSYFGGGDPIERLKISAISLENAKMDEKLYSLLEGGEALDDRECIEGMTKNGSEYVAYYTESNDALLLSAYIKASDKALISLDFTEDKAAKDTCIFAVENVLFPDIKGEYTTSFSFKMENNYTYFASELKESSFANAKKFTVTLPDNHFTSPNGALYRIKEKYDGTPYIEFVSSDIISSSSAVKIEGGTTIQEYLTEGQSFPDMEEKLPSLRFASDENGNKYAYSEPLEGGEYGKYRLFFVMTASGHIIGFTSDVFDIQSSANFEKIITSVK